MNQFDSLFFEQNSNFIDTELRTIDPNIRFPNGIERLEDHSEKYELTEEFQGFELESWFRSVLRKQCGLFGDVQVST